MDAFVAPVSERDHLRGPAQAAVAIIEYGDFECPTCKQAAAAAALLVRRFPGQVCLAYRHFPLEGLHSHALGAAEAAEAAGRQGRFWDMHDLLFAHQPCLGRRRLLELAGRLQLDLPQFRTELAGHSHVARIRADLERGRKAGVRSTPGLFVNGAVCDVSFGMTKLRRTVMELLAEPLTNRGEMP
jgi:protein-disulfide isomerase